MNVAMALWGAMSGAETEMWDHHLDELLDVFVSEVSRCGGPDLSVSELSRQVMLYVGDHDGRVAAGRARTDPFTLRRHRHDDDQKRPCIKNDESVRAPLQMLTNALNLWETQRFGELLDGALVP